MSWKAHEKNLWHNLRYYFGIYLGKMRKEMKNLSQDSWSLGWDLNPGPEYKAGVLATLFCSFSYEYIPSTMHTYIRHFQVY